jgi:hypothetical protein
MCAHSTRSRPKFFWQAGILKLEPESRYQGVIILIPRDLGGVADICTALFSGDAREKDCSIRSGGFHRRNGGAGQ